MSTPRRSLRSANLFVTHRKRRQQTGWSGWLYRGLDCVAPVTRSAPLRRGVQVICLVLYLVAFFHICWPYAETFSEMTFRDKAWYPVEVFLLLDPLVGISTALAGRVLNAPTFPWTLAILALCVLVPRAFCGYLCPLGTLIDGFDYLVGRWFRRLHVSENGPRAGWVHLKYCLLAAVLAAAVCGVMLGGFVSAIPVLTRGLLFTGGRMQLGLLKGPGHLTIVVCPTGAIQPLTIEVKRKTHMGLARVDTSTCLPYREPGRRDCDLCYFECRQAGYHAIEMREIEIPLDPPPPEGMFSDLELLEMSRIQAPWVNADACVGCGICEYRCHTALVKQQQELDRSAIVVVAENEHRLFAFPAQPDQLPPPG